MKTTVLSKLVAFCALMCFFLAPVAESKAQVTVPYRVRNILNCPVKIIYNVYEKNPNGTGCNILCFSNSAIIPAGASVPLPVWPNYPQCGCGIEICIVDVAGVPLATSICAGWPNPPFVPSNFGTDPTGGQCSPTGIIKLNVTQGVAGITP